MRKPTGIALGLALCASAFSAPARAEEPCATDARKLCAGIPPGDGRTYFCLKSHWNDLSDGCQQLMNWSQQRAYDVGLDCQADTFAWCQGVPPGQGRLFACLMSHRDSISSQCKEALTRVSDFNAGCSADAARLCPGMPPGGGAILTCLLSQRNQLSASCQAVFWP